MGDCNCQDTELPELREKETFYAFSFYTIENLEISAESFEFCGFLMKCLNFNLATSLFLISLLRNERMWKDLAKGGKKPNP